MSNPAPLVPMVAILGVGAVAGAVACVYGAGLLTAGLAGGIVLLGNLAGIAVGAAAGAFLATACNTLCHSIIKKFRAVKEQGQQPAPATNDAGAQPLSRLKKLTQIFRTKNAAPAEAQKPAVQPVPPQDAPRL